MFHRNCFHRLFLTLCYSKQFQRLLSKQGLKFKLNTKVLSADKDNGKLSVKMESAKDGKQETVCLYILPLRIC